jgi:hypothetical protein
MQKWIKDFHRNVTKGEIQIDKETVPISLV